jgi:hypothetical protein
LFSLAASKAGADDRQQDGLVGSRILEMVWKIGVEGHAVAGREL